ncbi:MAG: DegT/DnrJ/EryC1/StrS family aminotransferase [Betaproteobacteria bacterium]|nr:DegT/DnrJ/EryC1/StrS family aminotransferase [Betaproteobacteria bacterium]
MTKLALLGGTPLRSTPFPAYRSIGDEEKHAVLAVLDRGILSQFLGTWSPDFFGGPEVQALESEWAAYFGCKHAVAVNSATSGLYAAVGAAGIGPGDEVIVSPYTMSASATAALAYGGIPVFADIDPETFCLDPDSIRQRISPRTRAIIAVDIFGHPAAFGEIMSIAQQHNLLVIEDAAQAPGASLNGRLAGTLAHMGVFSLNYHKTIHCGEGGVIVTDDDKFADRLRLIRNHAEAVIKAKGYQSRDELVNLVGFNYRMTEIEAAIARQQLKKLDSLLVSRIAAAEHLTRRLAGMPGITPPGVASGVKHGYYVFAIKYDAAAVGMPRARFADALRAEGIPIGTGYVEPLYLQPMYQEQIAFGKDGFPFTLGSKEATNYKRGLCPIAEDMHFETVLTTDICHAGIRQDDLDDFVNAVSKVLDHRLDLKEASK